MYIYHALINALSAHTIHINLNTILCVCSCCGCCKYEDENTTVCCILQNKHFWMFPFSLPYVLFSFSCDFVIRKN